jgi:hypothetical protein
MPLERFFRIRFSPIPPEVFHMLEHRKGTSSGALSKLTVLMGKRGGIVLLAHEAHDASVESAPGAAADRLITENILGVGPAKTYRDFAFPAPA